MANFLPGLGFISAAVSGAVTSLWQTSPADVVSWVGSLVPGGVVSTFLLPSRAEDLGRETRDLSATRTTMLDEIERASLKRKKPTAEVQNWLEDVDKIGKREREFQNSFGQISGFSPPAYYRLGCDVYELNEEVRRLKARRKDLTVLCDAAPDPVVPWPSSATSIVGVDDALSRICVMLEDNSSTFIGIYGMGGVGKTTLLNKINNDLFQTKSKKFDLVIFVTVSNDVKIDKIQEQIGERLGFSQGQLPSNEEQRRGIFCESLVRKKFLLLLDDLWRELDLAKVGIHVSLLSEKGSKIVFTTRSAAVCNAMGAARNKVKVHPLSPEKSWELFCEKMGKREGEWNESTKFIAQRVVKKCGGLPQAIITLGRAMADTTTDGEWKLALTELPEDVTTNVLPILKFSFDRLKDRRLKECLLYCALYPEDQNIYVPNLIKYWVGEGFLDREQFHSIDEAYDFGRATISTLIAACLLEDVDSQRVKLHDLVREMMLTITSYSSMEEENVFLVRAGKKVVQPPMPERWTYATRVCFWETGCEELPETLQCHNLRTLLLPFNKQLRYIPTGFFMSMPLLTVLDLSSTRLKHLPQEIGSLVELRYLNISGCRVKTLPIELGKLIKLRILDLSSNPLKNISKDMISSLSSLQSLAVGSRTFKWEFDDLDSNEENACLKDLESLKQLNDVGVSIEICGDGDVVNLLGLRKLCSVITQLTLSTTKLSSLDMSDVLAAMKVLKELQICSLGPDKEQLKFPIDGQTKLEELYVEFFCGRAFSWYNCNTSIREPTTITIFKNLRILNFCWCPALVEIMWTTKLPCLESLYLHACSQMVEVIANSYVDHERDSFFPRLTDIGLRYLDNLENICSWPLLFYNLETVVVFDCPKLKKLPFDIDSAKNIRSIRCPLEWWNGLEWESDDTRLRFLPYFLEYEYNNEFFDDDSTEDDGDDGNAVDDEDFMDGEDDGDDEDENDNTDDEDENGNTDDEDFVDGEDNGDDEEENDDTDNKEI